MSHIFKDKQAASAAEQPSLDILQAGLFYLMTQYSFRQCPHIAGKIVEHLTMLCEHPQIALMPSQNHLFARMINIWRARQSDNHGLADTGQQLH